MANRPSGLAKCRPDVGVTSLETLMNLKQKLPSINHLSVPLRDPLRRCRRSVLMTQQRIESFSPRSHLPRTRPPGVPNFMPKLSLFSILSHMPNLISIVIVLLAFSVGGRDEGFDVFDASRLLRPLCLHCETPAIRNESCCGWWLVAAINKMLLTLA